MDGCKDSSSLFSCMRAEKLGQTVTLAGRTTGTLLPGPGWLDFLENVSGKGDRRWIFRGQADARWHLQPSIGRPDKTGPTGYRLEDEMKFFEEFRAEAQRFHSEITTNLELLALAQHHGLPTRLLDWSTNPLVAAWFACENEDNGADACVHMIRTSRTDIKLTSDFDPFNEDLAEIVLVRVPSRTARITAQQGVFSIHCSPERTWTYEKGKIKAIADYESFVIPSAEKPFFRAMLSIFGINLSRMMGGLDGAGTTLAREYRNR